MSRSLQDPQHPTTQRAGKGELYASKSLKLLFLEGGPPQGTLHLLQGPPHIILTIDDSGVQARAEAKFASLTNDLRAQARL